MIVKHRTLGTPTQLARSVEPQPLGAQKAVRILRLKHVLERVAISRAQLYLLMGKGQFPKNFSLSGPGGRSVGWLEENIDDWVASRSKQQSKAEVQ